MLALQVYLNRGGRYHCVYANFEAGQVARNNLDEGIGAIIGGLHNQVSRTLNLELPFTVNDILNTGKAANALNSFLGKICLFLDQPLVLLIDEIDALVGDNLVSVLRQLRSGYAARPEGFPISIILCGVRDIKNYRIHRSDWDIITGGSCFNIKAKSLTLGNFSEDEVQSLYQQHTDETGQQFEEACFPLLMRYTGG